MAAASLTRRAVCPSRTRPITGRVRDGRVRARSRMLAFADTRPQRRWRQLPCRSGCVPRNDGKGRIGCFSEAYSGASALSGR